MKLILIYDDKSSKIYNLDELLERSSDINYISATNSKEKNALKIIASYKRDKKIVLFDENNKSIVQTLKNIELADKDFFAIFFTSGSTGTPVGALKSKKHLEEEVAVLSKIFEKSEIKRVVVTVPFIHIYGFLAGILYPLLNGIDIVLKEHFMPYDLIDTIQDNDLVVTTPLYIKAMNKLNESKNFSKTVFLSSTAPLDKGNIVEFRKKYNSHIFQLFGSTETGGIGFKKDEEELWTPLEKVVVGQKEGTLVVDSPFVSDCLYSDGFKYINGSFETFDYVEICDNRFKLVGRSSKIIKVAGKRFSTVEIEDMFEKLDDITGAVVTLKKDKKKLKDEFLEIKLETHTHYSQASVEKILKQKFSNLRFPIKVVFGTIPRNQLGKKII